MSLQAHIKELNTFERIQKLIALNLLDEQLGKDTAETLSYLMNLRLKANLTTLQQNSKDIPNQLDTQKLSTLEREMLRDALHVVKRFKNTVHFHLGGV